MSDRDDQTGPITAPSIEETLAPRSRLESALRDGEVAVAASAYRAEGEEPSLEVTLRFARALCSALGDRARVARFAGELDGFDEAGADVVTPRVRMVQGFASPFPVRALDLGLLDPEEIFSINNEKFAQVSLTIGQPVSELARALEQIRAGGVLALKVPASEVTSASALTEPDAEVYIYILPGEIQRIVDDARREAMNALVRPLVEAALDDEGG